MHTKITLATWNINSLRLRVQHLAKIDADIICLQEIKCQNQEVPVNEIKKLGFDHHYVRGEKAYNGVGIFSKIPLSDVEMLDFGGNSQARHISALLPDGTRLHNFYVPAGRDIPDPVTNPHFAHKLKFVEDMTSYFESLKETNPSEAKARATPAKLCAALERNHIIVGDFNIAPFEHDVWSHKQMLDVISHTPMETERMDKMYKTLDWVDASRHFVPHNEKCYSWWSYRNQDWKKSNRGRRLDHIWVTPQLQSRLESHHILREARDWEKPSDHVPVIIQLS